MRFLIFLSVSFFAVYGYSLSCSGKGCLQLGHSKTLILYFRGHARGFGGSPGKIPKSHWLKSARAVMTKEPYNLQKYSLSSHFFATGSSHLSLSNSEVTRLLKLTGAKKLILAAHSGGYLGLRKTVLNLSKKLRVKVKSIFMLDNFYSASSTSRILKRHFPKSFLQNNCYGYTTPHNRLRFNQYFKRVCPATVHLKNGKHVSGLKCMENFDRGKHRCS